METSLPVACHEILIVATNKETWPIKTTVINSICYTLRIIIRGMEKRGIRSCSLCALKCLKNDDVAGGTTVINLRKTKKMSVICAILGDSHCEQVGLHWLGTGDSGNRAYFVVRQ